MTYALIGCSRISVNHVRAAVACGLEIVALCDLSDERMDFIANEFGLGGVLRFTDHRRMLEKVTPDLAAITTPSGSHAEIAVDCIESGVHLIIEKPIALSLADADRIIAAAAARGVWVSACHQNRFNASVQKVKKAVDDGRFGKLYHGTAHIRWNRGEDYYKQAAWRGTWEQDGGALMNQCIHNIDILRWLMGDDIIEVVGMTDRLAHEYIEAEDLGLALVRFGNGAYGVIEGTTNVYPNNLEEVFYIFGEKGTVKATGKSVEEWRFADGAEDKGLAEPLLTGHSALYSDVCDAIRSGRPPLVDALAGRRAIELVLAIYKSAALGVSVKLPLTDCATGDFLGRFDR